MTEPAKVKEMERKRAMAHLHKLCHSPGADGHGMFAGSNGLSCTGRLVGLSPGILSTALWCSGILLPLLLCASRRFLRGREDCPPDLCCPMSLELFRDPVVAADGETYEPPALS